MQVDFNVKIKDVARKLAIMAGKLSTYGIDGAVSEEMATSADVELRLKIFTTLNNWYDKTINQPGNLTGLIDSLSDEDKEYLLRLKSLEETEQDKFK